MSYRVTTPPRLRIVIGKSAAVRQYLAYLALRFIHDQSDIRSLNDFSRLGMQMKLRQADREAMSVRIVLGVLGRAFLTDFRRPGRVRQALFETGAKIEKSGERRPVIRSRWGYITSLVRL